MAEGDLNPSELRELSADLGFDLDRLCYYLSLGRAEAQSFRRKTVIAMRRATRVWDSVNPNGGA